MPLQNRVDPFGAIVATDARGTLMGNRGGCIHDGDRRLVRRWATKAWITCLLEFKGQRRELMKPGLYTELFFLDEATALAAGHRPCAECRRDDYRRFKAGFTAALEGRGVAIKTAPDMDAILHAERTSEDPQTAPARDLPDGVMVRLDDKAWLKRGGDLLEWSFQGYDGRRPSPDAAVEVLTPPSTLAVIRAGYQVGVHPSAGPSGTGAMG